jgi:hypothetical protein
MYRAPTIPARSLNTLVFTVSIPYLTAPTIPLYNAVAFIPPAGRPSHRLADLKDLCTWQRVQHGMRY